jgi:uncharacterized repeat protein (TIGR02543 family)
MKTNYQRLIITGILFCSLLILSCPNPFTHEQNEAGLNFDTKLPAGKGSFSLSVTAARTILPGTPSINDFAEYSLAFTAVSGGANLTVNRTNATLAADPIILESGTYNLVVTAFKTGNLPAARGTLNGITITAGTNTPGLVSLNALLGENGTTGTFSWNISFDINPAVTITSALMTIRNSSGVQTGAVENILTVPNGDRSNLASGIYTVTFVIERSDGNRVVWNELLHVYSTLLSQFTHTFRDVHFNNPNYNVRFNFNNGTNGFADRSVIHGNFINTSDIPIAPARTANAYLYSNTNLPNPSDIGFTLDGWYENALGTGSSFNFATTRIHSDTILYANWVPGGIDIYARSEPNDVEKAIGYVIANPNEYTLYVRNDLTISGQTLDVGGINLTIEGMGAGRELNYTDTLGSMFTLGANAATNNTLTLRNIKLNGSVSILPSANFTLAGNASLNRITLTASAVQNSSIEIASGWNGSVDRLDLYGLQISFDDVIDNWEGRTVLKGAITPAVITQFNNALGYFINDFSNIQVIQNHQIELESGVGILADITTNAQQPTINIHPQGGASYDPFVTSTALYVTAVSPDGGTLSYQWYSNTTNSNTNGTLINGATGTTFNPSTTTIVGTMYYYVVVTNTNNSVSGTQTATRNSNAAGITVSGNFNITNTDRWNTALSMIRNNGNNRTYTMNITDNINGITPLTGALTTNTGFGMATNIEITLTGDGVLNTANSNGSMIRVGEGQTLTIDGNLTLQGRRNGQNGHTNDNNAAVILIQANGTLELRNGTITGNTRIAGGLGGGVNITNTGTFTMTGGTISDNTVAGSGGGIHINSDATFEMTGGTISGNNAYPPDGIIGGGGVNSNGTFTMTLGTITSNTSSTSGGGVSVGIDGTFTMQGGTINNNTAATTQGGGVYTNGTFHMTGGLITGNTASTFGGGVSVGNGIFTKTGNSTITGAATEPTTGNAVRNTSDTLLNNRGHAVFNLTPERRRESTALTGLNLNSATDVNWEN